MHCGIHDSAYVRIRMYYYPQPPPAPRRPPGKTLGLDDSSREIYYPDNIQPSPGPGLMCKLKIVEWCVSVCVCEFQNRTTQNSGAQAGASPGGRAYMTTGKRRVCVWCPARMSGNGGMHTDHNSDRRIGLTSAMKS